MQYFMYTEIFWHVVKVIRYHVCLLSHAHNVLKVVTTTFVHPVVLVSMAGFNVSGDLGGGYQPPMEM